MLALYDVTLRSAPTCGMSVGPLSGMVVDMWGPEWGEPVTAAHDSAISEAQAISAASLHAAYYGNVAPKRAAGMKRGGAAAAAAGFGELGMDLFAADSFAQLLAAPPEAFIGGGWEGFGVGGGGCGGASCRAGCCGGGGGGEPPPSKRGRKLFAAELDPYGLEDPGAAALAAAAAEAAVQMAAADEAAAAAAATTAASLASAKSRLHEASLIMTEASSAYSLARTAAAPIRRELDRARCLLDEVAGGSEDAGGKWMDLNDEEAAANAAVRRLSCSDEICAEDAAAEVLKKAQVNVEEARRYLDDLMGFTDI